MTLGAAATIRLSQRQAIARRRLRRTIHLVVVIIGATVMFSPLIWLISGALKSSQDIVTYPPHLIPHPVRWQNLIDGWNFLGSRTFANSAIFTVSVVVLQLALSITTAFALAKMRVRGRYVLLSVFVGTLLVPPQVTLIPTYIVTFRLGWLNTYQGLILPVVAQTGFGVFLFHQFFMKMPTELISAARVDGASWPRIFWRIAVPLSRPAIAAYSAVTFLSAWNLYSWPLVVTTDPKMTVLPLALANIGTAFVQPNVGMAAVLLSTLPMAAIFLLAQSWFVQGIAGTGLKG